MILLFIDDDSEDTDLFREAVAYINDTELISKDQEPVECIVANDGYEAIQMIPGLRRAPDYIFLDINMPVMGGKDCLKHLKSNPEYSAIPVIMFSTTCTERDTVEFKSLGAIDCIKKPNGFKDLVRILSKYIFDKYL
jgi:CheY-like chemotaxis protein